MVCTPRAIGEVSEVRRGSAGLGSAVRGLVRQSKARLGKGSECCVDGLRWMASYLRSTLGSAGRGSAEHGWPRRGSAGQSAACHGVAWLGKGRECDVNGLHQRVIGDARDGAWHGWVGRGLARRGTVWRGQQMLRRWFMQMSHLRSKVRQR